MKPALLLAICVALIATESSALSCLRPDAARTFKALDAAPEPYQILRGQLEFDEAALPGAEPATSQGGNRQGAMIEATVRGHLLTAAGFTTPFEGPVTLNIGCAGPWCGGLTANIDTIAFVQLMPNGTRMISVEACPFAVFQANIDDRIVGQIAACASGEACEELPSDY